MSTILATKTTSQRAFKMCPHLQFTNTRRVIEVNIVACHHSGPWWLIGRASDSWPRGCGFDTQPGRHVAILGKLLYSHVPRPTQPFIPSGSSNEYQLRLGKKRQVLRCSRPCIQDRWLRQLKRIYILAGSKCHRDELLAYGLRALRILLLLLLQVEPLI